MAWISALVTWISQAFGTLTIESFGLLLLVAACAACGLVLYGLTRGREFLIFGYSSAVFLLPFVQWH